MYHQYEQFQFYSTIGVFDRFENKSNDLLNFDQLIQKIRPKAEILIYYLSIYS